MGFEYQARERALVTRLVAIRLVTLAACAWAVARGTVDLLTAAYLPWTAGTPALAHATTASRSPGSSVSDGTAVLKRNIFDSETGPLWPPSERRERPGLMGAEPVERELVASGTPLPCEGTTRLVASMYVPDRPDRSLAALSTTDGWSVPIEVGALVDGKEVSAIHPSTVLLRERDRLCSLSLFDRTPSHGVRPLRLRHEAPATRDDETPADPSSGQVTKIDETHFAVTRRFVDDLLSDPSELMRLARVVPHKHGGEIVGIKVYGIRQRSTLGRLGLQSGDLLRTVNGYDLSSPDAALEAYARLRSADQLSLAVTRRGRDIAYAYRIE